MNQDFENAPDATELAEIEAENAARPVVTTFAAWNVDPWVVAA